MTLEFKSSWDIEWDCDYGFVLTDHERRGLRSQPSPTSYTTDTGFNPNDSGCQASSTTASPARAGRGSRVSRLSRRRGRRTLNDYSHGAPFLADSYDISEPGRPGRAVVRFSYYTDGAFDRPGWFIDDIVVKVDGTPIYCSDFEAGAEADRLFPGGCSADGFKVAATCTDGWGRITAGAAQAADHAYYLELRDQSGFDFNGHGQSDRGDTGWQPGPLPRVHGRGARLRQQRHARAAGAALHRLQSDPRQRLRGAAIRATAPTSRSPAGGDNHFSDAKTAAQPGGFINSFSDPDSAYGDSSGTSTTAA